MHDKQISHSKPKNSKPNFCNQYIFLTSSLVLAFRVSLGRCTELYSGRSQMLRSGFLRISILRFATRSALRAAFAGDFCTVNKGSLRISDAANCCPAVLHECTASDRKRHTLHRGVAKARAFLPAKQGFKQPFADVLRSVLRSKSGTHKNGSQQVCTRLLNLSLGLVLGSL